jgi:multiple sugar transport system substrate-binding protein
MDEIYYAFILNDMMARHATGQMSAEDSVKQATRQCETIMKKWAGKA